MAEAVLRLWTGLELVKREANKRGITPSALLSTMAANTAARLTGEEPAPPSAKA